MSFLQVGCYRDPRALWPLGQLTQQHLSGGEAHTLPAAGSGAGCLGLAYEAQSFELWFEGHHYQSPSP